MSTFFERFDRLYVLAVLWTVTLVCPTAVRVLYERGHEDGSNELREWMRKELQQVQDALAQDRAKAFASGYSEGLRARVFEAQATPARRQRVM